MSDPRPLSRVRFLPETVHKRDIFSETLLGHLAGRADLPVVRRKLDGMPRYARPIAGWLARREARGAGDRGPPGADPRGCAP
ncbi:hypothetical protein [Roseovarius sp. A-2]|uniref:hypothetical protein n=1 Tax=Roseovarius sp. A-2 TaxID=1570360 RepID=UPI0009B54B58|nr:hypothetical protein [Roseovarius sp. A-2]